jgi:hypothetical protein
MFKRSFALVFILAVSGPAMAENYIVGVKGGMYCKTPDDLTNQIAAAMNGSHESFPGCGMLKPGALISTTVLNKIKGLVGGQGTSPGVLAGGDFAFTAVDEEVGAVSAPSPRPATAKAPAGDSTRSYKVVGYDDVRASPAKWLGRDLAFRAVQVYWVEDNDVRFITNSMVTVFGKNIVAPTKDIEYLRANCETSKEAFSSKCRATIHFSYSNFDEDHPTPLVKRLVIMSDDIAVIRH